MNNEHEQSYYDFLNYAEESIGHPNERFRIMTMTETLLDGMEGTMKELEEAQELVGELVDRLNAMQRRYDELQAKYNGLVGR